MDDRLLMLARPPLAGESAEIERAARDESAARAEVAQFAGAHDVLCARLVEQAGFDGIWVSSLGVSASYGRCDRDELSWQELADVAERIAENVSVPVWLDGADGGGRSNVVRQFAKRVSRRGVAGLCLEDKAWPRQNSLVGTISLLAPEAFAEKVMACRDAADRPGFSLIARTDAFIAGESANQVIARAQIYHKAGADAVIVHSRNASADQLEEFMNGWDGQCPIVAIPTTYARTPLSLFEELGVATVIWPNQLLRSAVAAMRSTLSEIRSGFLGARDPGGRATIDELIALGSCGWCDDPGKVGQ